MLATSYCVLNDPLVINENMEVEKRIIHVKYIIQR